MDLIFRLICFDLKVCDRPLYAGAAAQLSSICQIAEFSQESRVDFSVLAERLQKVVEDRSSLFTV
jgi:hypothetical protein